MNERFEYLVFKYLDKNIEKPELEELEKYLALQDNREYPSEMDVINNMLHKHFPVKLSREEIDKMLEERDWGRFY